MDGTTDAFDRYGHPRGSMNGWLITAALLALLFLAVRLCIRRFIARPLSTFDAYALAVDTAVDTRPGARAPGLPRGDAAVRGWHPGPDTAVLAEPAAPVGSPGPEPSVPLPPRREAGSVPRPRPGGADRSIPVPRSSGEDGAEVARARSAGAEHRR
jgi:hypothetical protein